MSVQFDFIPGFDPTSISSMTQAQYLQMVAQIAPLPNIGGIVYGATSPDVANNARFARYAWIDTSGGAPYVLKTYNGAAWVASTIGAGSISSATQIVDGILTLAKLSVAGGGAGKLIRVNAGNTAFEFINFSDLLAAGVVPFTAIETTGAAANYYLKRNNANTALNYELFDASDIALNSIGFTQLQNGAAAVNILKSSGASNAWQEVEHKLANMAPTGGTAWQIARVNSAATALEYATPQIIQVVQSESGSSDSTTNAVSNAAGTAAITGAQGKAYVPVEVPFTPKLASSNLLLEAIINFTNSANVKVGVAIFEGAGAGLTTTNKAAGMLTVSNADNLFQLVLRKIVPATNTTIRYYNLLYGNTDGASTVRVNSTSAGNILGGAAYTSLRVSEVLA